jgi:hypothetical protein
MTSTANGDRQPLVIGYDGSAFAKHAIAAPGPTPRSACANGPSALLITTSN